MNSTKELLVEESSGRWLISTDRGSTLYTLEDIKLLTKGIDVRGDRYGKVTEEVKIQARYILGLIERHQYDMNIKPKIDKHLSRARLRSNRRTKRINYHLMRRTYKTL